MATELIEKKVDDYNYGFEQFGAKESLKTLMRLSKIIGRPFVLCLDGYQGKGKPLKYSVISEAVSILSQSLNEEETLNIFELLTAKKLLCDGKQINFDTHYSGKLVHLFKVLNAALEVQYGNFFDALQEYMGVVTAPDSIPEK